MGRKRGQFLEDLAKRRACRALFEQEFQFSLDHNDDSEEQLIYYLRQSAAELGHSPTPDEVIGGSYLAVRFGNWDNALLRANLPRPCGIPKPENRKIYKREVQHQKELFLLEKKHKRELKLIAQLNEMVSV